MRCSGAQRVVARNLLAFAKLGHAALFAVGVAPLRLRSGQPGAGLFAAALLLHARQAQNDSAGLHRVADAQRQLQHATAGLRCQYGALDGLHLALGAARAYGRFGGNGDRRQARIVEGLLRRRLAA